MFVQSPTIKEFLELKISRNENSNLFLLYPRLFAGYFGLSRCAELDRLCIAIYLLYESSYPSEEGLGQNSKVLTNLLQNEALKIFLKIFDNRSRFWLYWKHRKRDFDKAARLEQILILNRANNSLPYKQLIDYKANFGKVALDALHILCGEAHVDIYESLLRSHIQFFSAYCYYNDLKNVDEDKAEGRFNWIVNRFAGELKSNHELIEINELKKYLFIRNIGQEVIIEAIGSLKGASEILGISKKTPWHEVVNELHVELEFYLEIVNEYISVLKERISGTGKTNESYNEVKKKGINPVKI